MSNKTFQILGYDQLSDSGWVAIVLCIENGKPKYVAHVLSDAPVDSEGKL